MTTITEQLGRVLAGRYRLDAGLGTGTSAHVYAAFDTRLGRQVAVKLLHPGLASDERFLRRLRAEAQAVAALNHPNVLKVFDWGDEHDGPFLVLEFLGGGSLQDLLDAGHRLDPVQAAVVGAQAARGLAYAHRRGFVHRDVKPGNLLFDEDGGLRVADFGLARALAEAAWTEPAGAVLGTARYASPEQAEGRPLDDRSDVYSLALVIYEGVVGRVPFSADTTLATLMARIGAPLPIVPELGPLAPILAQAAISEPLARLDAEELADNLELLARQMPRVRPLPLARHVATSPPPAEPPPVLPVAPSTAASPPSAPARPLLYDAENELARAPRDAPPARPLATADAGPHDVGHYDAGHYDAGHYDAGHYDAGPYDSVHAVAAEEPPPRRQRRSARPSRRRTGRRVLFAALAGVVLAGGAAAVVRFVVYGHTVPDLRGLPLGTARTEATHAGLQLEVRATQFSATVPAGEIVSESPPAGRLERSGVHVHVVVSAGRAPVAVPTVIGTAEGEAVLRVRSAHLIAHVSTTYSETVAAGTVISQQPSSGTARYGSQVLVVVSRGPAPRTIPSGLDGAAWASVRASLVALRLVPAEQLSYSSSVPSGDVISTTPAGGIGGVSVGSSVGVVVSRGPRLVAVPSVKGLSISSALALLKDAGLDVTEQVGPPNATYATTTDPAPEAEVTPGTQVTLYVA